MTSLEGAQEPAGSPEARSAAPASEGVIRIPENVLMQRAADEIVFLNLADNTYYGLEPIGSRMVELLLQRSSIADIVSQLATEYLATPDVLDRDVRLLVRDLVSSGLAEVVSPIGEPPASDA
jgi:hypothetical protein